MTREELRNVGVAACGRWRRRNRALLTEGLWDGEHLDLEYFVGRQVWKIPVLDFRW